MNKVNFDKLGLKVYLLQEDFLQIFYYVKEVFTFVLAIKNIYYECELWFSILIRSAAILNACYNRVIIHISGFLGNYYMPHPSRAIHSLYTKG